jgi:DNA-binding response OmpR family regulator
MYVDSLSGIRWGTENVQNGIAYPAIFPHPVTRNMNQDTPIPPACILIVDDERNERELLEVMLTSEGYRFLTAASGEEAISLVTAHQPDLILLDVLMPGLSGYDVAVRIKGDPALKHIPIVMVSSLDNRPFSLLGLTAGAEDYLTKPLNHAELGLRVRNLLRLKAYGDFQDDYRQKLESDVRSCTADLRTAKDAAEAANRARDESLTKISHEIRTPMTGVIGMIDLLLKTELTSQQREYVRIGKMSADVLLTFVDDILEFSTVDAVKPGAH